MTHGVRHTGIVVQNIDEAIYFWTFILSFEIVSDNLESGSFIEHLLGRDNITVRTVKMVASDKSMIELLWFPNNLDSKTWNGNFTSTGLTHVALNVKNIKEIIDKSSKLGFAPINEPRISKDSNVKVVFLSGPEGLLIELVEELD